MPSQWPNNLMHFDYYLIRKRDKSISDKSHLVLQSFNNAVLDKERVQKYTFRVGDYLLIFLLFAIEKASF